MAARVASATGGKTGCSLASNGIMTAVLCLAGGAGHRRTKWAMREMANARARPVRCWPGKVSIGKVAVLC